MGTEFEIPVAQSGSQPARLPRRLGLLNALSINMSNMVGTGPFITVPAILATMGGPQSLIAWGVGAALAIADGLVFAELGSAIPASGGSYIFLRECFGRQRWGHMLAWIFVWQFLFSGTLEIATSSIGMAEYTGFLWPGLLVPLGSEIDGGKHHRRRHARSLPQDPGHRPPDARSLDRDAADRSLGHLHRVHPRSIPGCCWLFRPEHGISACPSYSAWAMERCW